MKAEVRKEILGKRKYMSKEEVQSLSNKIQNYILEWNPYKESKGIMAYMDFRNEVKTDKIINNAFEEGKTLVLPKSIKETITILPCIVESIGDLKLGTYGIMEPDDKNIADINTIDMVLVPGVAFDKDGYRLGYGAGYYDRFLKDYKGIKVGLCFDLQWVHNVYKDEHDISMDYLITERGIIRIGD